MAQFRRMEKHRHTQANLRVLAKVWVNWNGPIPLHLENLPGDCSVTIVNTVSTSICETSISSDLLLKFA